jgi:hypothetical protein
MVGSGVWHWEQLWEKSSFWVPHFVQKTGMIDLASLNPEVLSVPFGGNPKRHATP